MSKERESTNKSSKAGERIGEGLVMGGAIACLFGIFENPNLVIAGIILAIGGLEIRADARENLIFSSKTSNKPSLE